MTCEIDLLNYDTNEVVTKDFPLSAADMIYLTENNFHVYDTTRVISIAYTYNIPLEELTIDNVNRLVEYVEDLDYDPELVLDLYYDSPYSFDSIRTLFTALNPYDLECDYSIESYTDYAMRELEGCGCRDIQEYIEDLDSYGQHLIEEDYMHYSIIDNYGLMSCGGWYDYKNPEADMDYLINVTNKVIENTAGKKIYVVVPSSEYRFKFYAIVDNEEDAQTLCSMDHGSVLTYYDINKLSDLVGLIPDYVECEELAAALSDFLEEVDHAVFMKSYISFTEEEGKREHE